MQRPQLVLCPRSSPPDARGVLAVALAIALTAASCGDRALEPPPAASLVVEGQAVGAAGAYAFPDAIVGERLTASLEIVNAGAGPLTLTGSPRVRVTLDDALAFDVRPPDAALVPPGATAPFSVSFTPRVPGRFEARLAIATDDPAAPELSVALTGVGRPDPGVPALALTLAGAPAAPEGWDFGLVRLGATAQLAVQLANVGTGSLLLDPAASVALQGPGAGAFTIDGAVPAELAAGAVVALDATFSPSRCDVAAADLVVRDDAGTELARVPLEGRGVSDPARFPAVLPPAPAGLDVTRRVVASADGRRVVVADPLTDAFAGGVTIYAFDGCELATTDVITAGGGGVASSLVGEAVGLSGDGDTLLVTAFEATRAWIFELTPGSSAAETGPAATLGRGEGAAGFGASAALSGDGRIAVIGANEGQADGVVLLYAVPGASGSADTVLLPTAELGRGAGIGLGTEVALSGDGAVVAASLLTGGSAPRAAALVWDANVSGPWAPGGDGEPTVVAESARLVASTGPPVDGAAHLAMARDGRTIALSAAQAGGSVLIFLFVRPQARWGEAAGGPPLISETATLRLSASPAWRFAVASDGGLIVGADPAGGRLFARPPGGWVTDTASVAVSDLGLLSWPALTGGDRVVLGVAPDGALLARRLD